MRSVRVFATIITAAHGADIGALISGPTQARKTIAAEEAKQRAEQDARAAQLGPIPVAPATQGLLPAPPVVQEVQEAEQVDPGAPQDHAVVANGPRQVTENKNRKWSPIAAFTKWAGWTWDKVPDDKMQDRLDKLQFYVDNMMALRYASVEPEAERQKLIQRRKLLHENEKVYFMFESAADQNVMLWTSEQILHVQIHEGWSYYIRGLKFIGTEQPKTEFRAIRWANILAWSFKPVAKHLSWSTTFTLQTERDEIDLSVSYNSIEGGAAYDLFYFLSWRITSVASLNLKAPRKYAEEFAQFQENNPCDEGSPEMEKFKKGGENQGILSKTQLLPWKTRRAIVNPVCVQNILLREKVLMTDENVDLALSATGGAIDKDIHMRDSIVFTQYRIIVIEVPNVVGNFLGTSKALYSSYTYHSIRAWTLYLPKSFFDMKGSVIKLYTKVREEQYVDGGLAWGPMAMNLNVNGQVDGAGATWLYNRIWGEGTDPTVITNLLAWRVLGLREAPPLDPALENLRGAKSEIDNEDGNPVNWFDWILQSRNNVELHIGKDNVPIYNALTDKYLVLGDGFETVELIFEMSIGLCVFTNRRIVLIRNKGIGFKLGAGLEFLGGKRYVTLTYDAIQSFKVKDMTTVEQKLQGIAKSFGSTFLQLNTDIPDVFVPMPVAAATADGAARAGRAGGSDGAEAAVIAAAINVAFTTTYNYAQKRAQVDGGVESHCDTLWICQAFMQWGKSPGLNSIRIQFAGQQALFKLQAYLTFRLTRIGHAGGNVLPAEADKNTALTFQNLPQCNPGKIWQKSVSWMKNQYYQEDPVEVTDRLLTHIMHKMGGDEMVKKGKESGYAQMMFLPGEEVHFAFTAQNRMDIVLFTNYRIVYRDYTNWWSQFLRSGPLSKRQGSSSWTESIPYEEIHYWKLRTPGGLSRAFATAESVLTINFGLRTERFRLKESCAAALPLYRFLSSAIVGKSDDTLSQSVDSGAAGALSHNGWRGQWSMVDTSDQFSKVSQAEAKKELYEAHPRCMLGHEANTDGALAFRKPRDWLYFPKPQEADGGQTPTGRFFYKNVIGPLGYAMELHSWRYDKIVGWEMYTQMRKRRVLFGRPGLLGAREYFRVLGTRFEAPDPMQDSQQPFTGDTFFKFKPPKTGAWFAKNEKQEGDVFDAFHFFENHFIKPPADQTIAQHLLEGLHVQGLQPSAPPAAEVEMAALPPP